MAAFDYSETAAAAQELIEEFGRPVTLVQLEEAPDDDAKPWGGAVNPRDAATELDDIPAVFVPVTGLAEFGFKVTVRDGVPRVDQALLVAGAAVAGSDLEDFGEAVDAGVRYAIERAHRLQPGDTVLLWALEVRR